ncbi:MAG: Fic family protein [Lachnospiraceae bacterium]|nr:Fic family protein [Lachnospiraceae bacterium]
MHIFDYSFLDNGLLPAGIVNLTSTISALAALANERRNNNQSVYTQLESIARVQSVKNSNAIEGIITTDVRIAEIVNGNSEPLNHNEMEIAGYRDALDEIHRSYKLLPVSEETVLHMHKVMLNNANYAHGGQYKAEDNLIMEVDSSGRRTIRFKPIPASDTKEAMEQLLLAYIDARNNANINQLLLIPCVILDFLCIHPFSDGNGRVSRLLTLLLLYKSEYDICKYISFEEQINYARDAYYQALYESSQGWHESKNSYISFMENFLMTLYKCYKELDQRFSTINGKRLKKNERIEQTVLNSILPISKSEICRFLPDVSVTTVEAVLGKMVKAGTVRKLGQARNIKYVNAKYVK